MSHKPKENVKASKNKKLITPYAKILSIFPRMFKLFNVDASKFELILQENGDW